MNKFFTVSHAMTIDGMLYKVGICYPLTDRLQNTVEELQATRLAKIYPCEVKMVSGKAYVVGTTQVAEEVGVSAQTIPTPSKRKKPITTDLGEKTAPVKKIQGVKGELKVVTELNGTAPKRSKTKKVKF